MTRDVFSKTLEVQNSTSETRSHAIHVWNSQFFSYKTVIVSTMHSVQEEIQYPTTTFTNFIINTTRTTPNYDGQALVRWRAFASRQNFVTVSNCFVQNTVFQLVRLTMISTKFYSGEKSYLEFVRPLKKLQQKRSLNSRKTYLFSVLCITSHH